MKVKIFADYWEPANAARIYNRNWETDIFTGESDYTHALILNICHPDTKLPADRVIGLAQEPVPEYFTYPAMMHYYHEYLKRKVKAYYIGREMASEMPVFKMGMGFLPAPMTEQCKPKKKRLMSILASDKMEFIGHKYRHALIEKILSTDLDIDIYGRGLNNIYKGDSRIKGAVGHQSAAMKDYRFSIAIENSCSQFYVTEKFFYPLIYNCVPVYFGAVKIKELFGDCCISLTGQTTKDIHILRDIFDQPEAYEKKVDIENAMKIARGPRSLPEFLKGVWK